MKLFNIDFSVHVWDNTFSDINSSTDISERCGLDNWVIDERVSNNAHNEIVAEVGIVHNKANWISAVQKYFNSYSKQNLSDPTLNNNNIICVEDEISKMKTSPNSPTLLHVTSVSKLIRASTDGLEAFKKLARSKITDRVFLKDLSMISTAPLPYMVSLTDEHVKKVFDFSGVSANEKQAIIEECLPYETDNLVWLAVYKGVENILTYSNWPDLIRDALGLGHYSSDVYLTVFRIDAKDLTCYARPTVIEVCGNPLYAWHHPSPNHIPFGVCMNISIDIVPLDRDRPVYELVHEGIKLKIDQWQKDFINVTITDPPADINSIRKNHKSRLSRM